MPSLLKYVAELAFPLPLLVLMLLLIPFPRYARVKVSKLADAVLSFKFIGQVKLVYCSIAFMAINLANYAYVTYEAAQKVKNLDASATAAARQLALGHKWREERNFWIVFFGLMLWIVLWRVNGMAKRVLKQEDQIRQLESNMPSSSNIGPAPPTDTKKSS